MACNFEKNQLIGSLWVSYDCHIPRFYFNTLLKMMYGIRDVNGSFLFFTTFIINFSTQQKENINIYSVSVFLDCIYHNLMVSDKRL